MTDELLITKLRMDDDTAMKHLYMTHRDAFINWSVKKYDIRPQDAKDVFQDSIMALRENILQKEELQFSVSIKNYLFGIGKNLIHQALRKKAKLESSAEDIILKLNNQQSDPQKDLIYQLINQELQNLSHSCHKLLKLYYISGYNMSEIARLMDLKNDLTAKSQKYRCLNQLRKAVFLNRKHNEI